MPASRVHSSTFIFSDETCEEDATGVPPPCCSTSDVIRAGCNRLTASESEARNDGSWPRDAPVISVVSVVSTVRAHSPCRMQSSAGSLALLLVSNQDAYTVTCVSWIEVLTILTVNDSQSEEARRPVDFTVS